MQTINKILCWWEFAETMPQEGYILVSNGCHVLLACIVNPNGKIWFCSGQKYEGEVDITAFPFYIFIGEVPCPDKPLPIKRDDLDEDDHKCPACGYDLFDY